MAYHWEQPVTVLPGIGPARAKKLEKLGITDLGTLISYFPRSYEDRREICTIYQAVPGHPVCIEAMVATPPYGRLVRKGLTLTKVRVVDEAGALDITFFNQPYVKDSLVLGQSYVFYGVVEGSGQRKSMTNPVFEASGNQRTTGRIVPVYPLTEGIRSGLLAGAIGRVLEDCLAELEDPLPREIRERNGLMALREAYRTIHFPEDFDTLERARRRLVFQELFFLACALALLRQRRSGAEGYACGNYDLSEYFATLPFSLTGAQRRAAEDCAADLRKGAPMNRLIQGDVGSGKTVVAAAAVWLGAKSGYQSALMAPTEILAEQHFRTLSPLLEKSGIRAELLTGSMKAKQKRDIYERLELGMIDLVIGTHALISEGVRFKALGLVITDEQHRFGVGQRAALAAKGVDKDGRRPHVLVVSATPIPRTLALIIYGDLEVSIINELPPGRQNIDTFRVHSDKRKRMYGFVRKQIEEGHQVYIVCPAVEENPEAQAMNAQFGGVGLKAVTEYTAQLQREVFPDLRVDFVHGRMASKAKEEVMGRFARGELDILVSTTVIEVGVDVPNATLMIVENAERFGLSQLHQLRGRVGRGGAKSYCVLVSDNNSPETSQRLKVLCSTNDGFVISEEDLKLRGPGDFFGSRQHGLPQLQVADLAEDMEVLRTAQQEAKALLTDDPTLTKAENSPILKQVHHLFRQNPDIFN